MRNYSLIDRCIEKFESLFQSQNQPVKPRENPADHIEEDHLELAEQRQSEALMRVNHSGEVCAQALYLGQAALEKDPKIKKLLLNAAAEEKDHLAWCEQRIKELNGRTSYLNPLWFSGSFLMGLTASLFGKNYSLGFLEETEKQVFAHLEKHLQKISHHDKKSRAILEAMQQDEKHHETTAAQHGAKELPQAIKKLMQKTSRMMTKTTYFI